MNNLTIFLSNSNSPFMTLFKAFNFKKNKKTRIGRGYNSYPEGAGMAGYEEGY